MLRLGPSPKQNQTTNFQLPSFPETSANFRVRPHSGPTILVGDPASALPISRVSLTSLHVSVVFPKRHPTEPRAARSLPGSPAAPRTSTPHSLLGWRKSGLRSGQRWVYCCRKWSAMRSSCFSFGEFVLYEGGKWDVSMELQSKSLPGQEEAERHG